MAYVVELDTDTGTWSALEPLEERLRNGASVRRAVQVGWLKEGQVFLVRHEVDGRPAPGTAYTLYHDRWMGRTVDAKVKLPPRSLSSSAEIKGLSVSVQQGVNEPPVVVASNGRGEVALTPPDPALQGVWWARSIEFQWREPSGRTESGGLLLPRGYTMFSAGGGDRSRTSETHLLPLVIQAYRYDPQTFAPDGPYRHAYAAQTLIAHGIAVLNINIPNVDRREDAGTPREVEEFKERVDSAIDALASRGPIDRARIGLVGFSRGGFNTYYAITHPGPTPLAAAVIDDSFPGTYADYIFTAAYTQIPSTGYERQYDGPFWKNKSAWLKYGTSFNVDQVRTPALFSIHGRANIAETIDTIGAFSLNHRPLEYLIFPLAGHYLEAPHERFASLETTAEWMAFWLQGKAPSDPVRAARWSEMRTAWDATQKRELEHPDRPKETERVP